MTSYSDQTKDWQKYSKGKSYNNSIKPNYYTNTDLNIAMVSGDQWRNVQSNGQPTPVFNIEKRVMTFFVASIMSSKTKLNYKPLAYSETEDKQPLTQEMADQKTASDMANAETDNLFEKFGMDNRFRDALFKAGIMGDVAAHLWWDKKKKPYGGGGQFKDIKGEICLELVNGTNVYLGNANNPTISTDVQPYVILSGRDTVENLKREAKAWKAKQVDIDAIAGDKDNLDQAGDMGKIEINIEGDEYGKATYIIIYTYDFDTETIHVSKCTENIYMYEDIDTELSYYPVAWLNWEKQENQYHGRSLVTGIHPNQIFINKMFAMVMYDLMNTAFPIKFYDADKISAMTNEIGASVGLKGLMPGERVSDFAYVLQGASMSAQIVQCIELAMSMTKEMLGLTDAWSGQANPDNFKAIAVTVQQSGIPLENPKANFYEWVEDIGRILLDMMGTYYGTRPIVMSQNGQSQIVQYDFTQFKNLWLKCSADVGPSSYWSENAQVQMLDNLLKMKDPLFNMVDYLGALPEGYSNKELLEKLQGKLAQSEQMAQQQAQAQGMQQQAMQGQQQQQIQQHQDQQNQQHEQVAQFFDKLPDNVKQSILALPQEEQGPATLKLMHQNINQTMKGGATNG